MLAVYDLQYAKMGASWTHSRALFGAGRPALSDESYKERKMNIIQNVYIE